MHLDEVEVGGVVEFAGDFAVGPQRRDHRRDGDHPGVGEQTREMAYPPDVLGAISGREAEIVGDPVPDVVAVDEVGDAGAIDQFSFERDGNRRLAGSG